MEQTLFKIQGDVLALEQLIIEQGGELSPTLEQWLAEVDTNLATKADSYVAVMERFESSAEYYKAKARQFTDAARQLENARERLKDRIKLVMVNTNRSEIKGNDYVFKIGKSAPRLLIEEALLEPIYIKLVESFVPNKEKIREALDAGVMVPGATLVTGQTLRTTVNKGTK